VIVREKSKFKGFLLENLNEQLNWMLVVRLISAGTKYDLDFLWMEASGKRSKAKLQTSCRHRNMTTFQSFAPILNPLSKVGLSNHIYKVLLNKN